MIHEIGKSQQTSKEKNLWVMMVVCVGISVLALYCDDPSSDTVVDLIDPQ